MPEKSLTSQWFLPLQPIISAFPHFPKSPQAFYFQQFSCHKICDRRPEGTPRDPVAGTALDFQPSSHSGQRSCRIVERIFPLRKRAWRDTSAQENSQSQRCGRQVEFDSAHLAGALNTSRTFRARPSGVNGFWMKASVASTTPCNRTASSVYPLMNSTLRPGRYRRTSSSN